MQTPADVFVQAQARSVTEVTSHKKVSVLWLAELRFETAVQCCFRTQYEHQPQHAKECGFGTKNQGLLGFYSM